MKNKSLLIILIIICFILLIPFVVMQFTEEVNWNFSDFLIAGVLLFGFGLLINYSATKIKKPILRIVLPIILLIILILVWMEMAVGLFGTTIGGQ